MKRLLVLLSIFFPAASFSEIIDIKYGTNKLDLNGDGVSDLIIKTDRESGTAHGYIMYAFALDIDGKYENIKFEGVNRAKETPGVDCNESVIRLEKIGRDFFLTKILLREPDFFNGESFATPREAIRKKYSLEGLEWKPVEETALAGKHCELSAMF
ncbi:MAG: hypothetical protein LBL46_04775 [Rickettsiales bacterium]|jgi:hypothetical protein|nr:hypothetical protein [Rickettsiales bacterium]